MLRGLVQRNNICRRFWRRRFDLRLHTQSGSGLFSDADRSAHNAYGAWGERPGRGEGVIRSSFLIDPQGKVKKSWYFVKPDGHALEVLQALQS